MIQMLEKFRIVILGKFLFALWLGAGFSLNSQAQSALLASYEDSLKVMVPQLILPENDFERLALNEQFREVFRQALELPGSLQYPFDSLLTVSRLRAPDGSFRIITWYVPLANHRFEYFGFFQVYHDRSQKTLVYELTDKSSDILEPEMANLDHEQWFGAFYTELIHNRHSRKDYYTLLGWRGDNPLTRKRIIEPLKMAAQGRPVFGQPVFRYGNNKHRRIIFEYSSRVSMALRYESHPAERGRRERQMIVFDRMAPTQDFLKGQYQFYVPETNIFDGFIFEEGKWVFTPDVDARNPRRRPPPRPLPPLE